jgi:hypothetical protein
MAKASSAPALGGSVLHSLMRGGGKRQLAAFLKFWSIFQMSEQFNQELSLSGKIPSGFFNTMFEFTGSWQKDAACTKSLAFDGWYITLYTVALSKAQIVLRDHVKQAVPSIWEPAALARLDSYAILDLHTISKTVMWSTDHKVMWPSVGFQVLLLLPSRFIKKFGTHIIVGLKMGGKDVIYLKQQHSSSLQALDVQKRLKDMSDRRFLDASGQSDMSFMDTYGNNKVFSYPPELSLPFVFATYSPSHTIDQC